MYEREQVTVIFPKRWISLIDKETEIYGKRSTFFRKAVTLYLDKMEKIESVLNDAEKEE